MFQSQKEKPKATASPNMCNTSIKTRGERYWAKLIYRALFKQEPRILQNTADVPDYIQALKTFSACLVNLESGAKGTLQFYLPSAPNTRDIHLLTVETAYDQLNQLLTERSHGTILCTPLRYETPRREFLYAAGNTGVLLIDAGNVYDHVPIQLSEHLTDAYLEIREPLPANPSLPIYHRFPSSQDEAATYAVTSAAPTDNAALLAQLYATDQYLRISSCTYRSELPRHDTPVRIPIHIEANPPESPLIHPRTPAASNTPQNGIIGSWVRSDESLAARVTAEDLSLATPIQRNRPQRTEACLPTDLSTDDSGTPSSEPPTQMSLSRQQLLHATTSLSAEPDETTSHDQARTSRFSRRELQALLSSERDTQEEPSR